MNVGVLAYGLSTAAFLLLTLLLIAGWQGREKSGGLVSAAVVTTAWSALLAFQAQSESISYSYVYLAEVLRDGAWFVALGSIARGSLPRALQVGSHLLWVGVLVVLVLVAFGPFRGEHDEGLIFSRGALAMAVVGLILLEQIYRNSDAANRSAFKYFLIGVGGLFAYDVFLYSQAELIQGIKGNYWFARGVANAICVPLIIVAIRRSPERSFSIFVSRHVVFHTTAMLGIGGYLILMSIGGYYVRMVGGSWGLVAEAVFLVGALSLLIVLVFMGQLRRKLSVFIAKHFYRNKYDYRIEWLRFIRTLSENPEGDVKRAAVRAVAQILDSPGGVLLTIDESARSYVPAASWPMPLESLPSVTELGTSDDMIQFMRRRQWIIDLQEYGVSPGLYENVSIPQWILSMPGLRIVSPMMELDNLVGLILLYSPPEPFRLTYEDRDLLKMVGQHVATHIGQHEADRKLAESRQFEAYNKLTAFMMHDLKNCNAQLQLIVTNAVRHKSNPEFIDDAISTIANAAGRITHLVEHLEDRQDRQRLQVVALGNLVEAAVRRCSGRQPAPRLTTEASRVMIRADADRLEAIIEHVIKNAQDASEPDAIVTVQLTSSGETALLTVADSGSGMTSAFIRERLFRPFDSTKGSKGMGIGAYQTREYVRMLGGDVKVQSSPGIGTTFSIMLPCLAATEHGGTGHISTLLT
jgi:putative PEP-CTERM system histidine kinase